MGGAIKRYLAAKVFRFHIPIVRKGRRYGSVVVRLFRGKMDRYGNPGTVAALELHIANLKEAVRDGAAWYDKRSGRFHVTLAKAGPDDLRRIAYRLLAVADAIEMAEALGLDPAELEKAWLEVKSGAAKERGGRRSGEDDLDLDLDEDVETGEEDVFE